MNSTMHHDSLFNESELVFFPHMARVHERIVAGFICACTFMSTAVLIMTNKARLYK